MDKYVFHSNFYVIYMDGMDIILRYPWMELVGTININARKNFLEHWYKKKVKLPNISLSQQIGPKMAHEEILIEKLIVIPTNTLYQEVEVESKQSIIEAHE